jgi:hypothetical protein
MKSGDVSCCHDNSDVTNCIQPFTEWRRSKIGSILFGTELWFQYVREDMYMDQCTLELQSYFCRNKTNISCWYDTLWFRLELIPWSTVFLRKLLKSGGQ